MDTREIALLAIVSHLQHCGSCFCFSIRRPKNEQAHTQPRESARWKLLKQKHGLLTCVYSVCLKTTIPPYHPISAEKKGVFVLLLLTLNIITPEKKTHNSHYESCKGRGVPPSNTLEPQANMFASNRNSFCIVATRSATRMLRPSTPSPPALTRLPSLMLLAGTSTLPPSRVSPPSMLRFLRVRAIAFGSQQDILQEADMFVSIDFAYFF